MKCSRTYIKCGSVSCWAANCSLSQGNTSMRKDFVKEPITPNFEATLSGPPAKGGGADNASVLLLLVAQVLDAAASGEDCYLHIGLTRPKDAAVVKLHLNGSTVYASGKDWTTLLGSLSTLI